VSEPQASGARAARRRSRQEPGAGKGRAALGLLALAALVAAACGPAGGGAATFATECPVGALNNVEGTVDVTLWHSYVGLTEQTLRQLADEYNASQDTVHIDVQSQGVGYEELQRKYEQAIPANDLPGIAIMEDTNTQLLADSQTVLPAGECAEAEDYEDFADFVPVGVDYYSVDDVLLPGSLNLATALLYYNRDHFEAAGLDPDDPPQTLDELVEAARAIKDAGVVDQPFVMNMQPWMIEFWLTGAGGPLVDNNNGRDLGGAERGAFDNPVTHRLFETLNEMHEEGLLNALPGTEGQFDHYFAMGLESASMTVETSTAVTTINAVLEGTASGEDLGLGDLELPQIDVNLDASEFPGLEEPGHGQVGGGVWYITSTTPPEVQAGAWDFMKYVNRPENQRLWHMEGSYLPSRSDAPQDPEIQRFWEEERAGIWLSRAYGLLTDLDPEFPGPLIGPYREVRTAIGQALDGMMFDGRSPDDVIAEADATITEAIQHYNEINF
jgi:sn-glycerol 3-phosphate transport system substrate-binding protein